MRLQLGPFAVGVYPGVVEAQLAVDERAAIAYADAMTTDPHLVTDEQVVDLRRRFGDAGTMELTYQIGIENMRARMNTALGITEQGFGSGDACRVPWATDQDAAATQ